MAGITTAYATSAKSEHYAGAHCFQGTVTPTGSSSSSIHYTSVSSMTGVCVGMSVSGTNVASGSVVSVIVSASAFDTNLASTGSISGGTLTISGDVFKIALIKVGPAGTYGAASTNFTDITGNSDEVSGAGYTTGGVAMTNVSPAVTGTTAYVNFSPNPSWTSASFSTTGAMIYNSSTRLGGTSGTNTAGGGRCMGTFDFSGTQTVSSGTLTVLMPSPGVTSIFRIA